MGLTRESIAALRAVIDKATKGEWDKRFERNACIDIVAGLQWIGAVGVLIGAEESGANARAIVALHNAANALLDAAELAIDLAEAAQGMRCFHCRRYISDTGVEVGPCRECEPIRRALSPDAKKDKK